MLIAADTNYVLVNWKWLMTDDTDTSKYKVLADAKSSEPSSEPEKLSGNQQKFEAPSANVAQLSNYQQLLQDMQNALRHLPVVDHQRVTAIKKAIANHSYRINPAVVASKLLDFEKNLHSCK